MDKTAGTPNPYQAPQPSDESEVTGTQREQEISTQPQSSPILFLLVTGFSFAIFYALLSLVVNA